MFKTLLTAFLALSLSSIAYASDVTKVSLGVPYNIRHVSFRNLPQDRIFTLIGSVNDSSIPPLVRSLKAAANDNTTPLYIVINSPGGSVDDGMYLIQTIQGLRDEKRIKTICIVTNEGYSMAAIIASFCHQTYMLPTARLMFHQVSTGVRGQIPEIEQSLNVSKSYIKQFETVLAAQLGISYEVYAALRENEYWLTAPEATQKGFADGIVPSFHFEEPEADNNTLFRFLPF